MNPGIDGGTGAGPGTGVTTPVPAPRRSKLEIPIDSPAANCWATGPGPTIEANVEAMMGVNVAVLTMVIFEMSDPTPTIGEGPVYCANALIADESPTETAMATDEDVGPTTPVLAKPAMTVAGSGGRITLEVAGKITPTPVKPAVPPTKARF